MLKVIGCICVLVSSTYYGFYLSFICNKRIAVKKEWIYLCSLLESYINYSLYSMDNVCEMLSEKSGISEIKAFFKQISKKLKKSDIEFDELWRKMIMEEFPYLSKNDKNILYKLGELTNLTNKNTQIDIIRQVKEELNSNLAFTCEESIKKQKIYKILGVSFGLIIVISLI